MASLTYRKKTVKVALAIGPQLAIDLIVLQPLDVQL